MRFAAALSSGLDLLGSDPPDRLHTTLVMRHNGGAAVHPVPAIYVGDAADVLVRGDVNLIVNQPDLTGRGWAPPNISSRYRRLSGNAPIYYPVPTNGVVAVPVSRCPTSYKDRQRGVKGRTALRPGGALHEMT
jgi:hypothetical protein